MPRHPDTKTSSMSISDVAARTGLTTYTLRYYEDLDLIVNIERAPSGHRSYTELDVQWIEFLIRLRTTGMPIDEMRTFAALRRAGPSTAPHRQQLLDATNNESKPR
ncbi:MAG: MerR family transcriptional regulator [Actinomycetota bacterium]